MPGRPRGSCHPTRKVGKNPPEPPQGLSSHCTHARGTGSSSRGVTESPRGHETLPGKAGNQPQGHPRSPPVTEPTARSRGQLPECREGTRVQDPRPGRPGVTHQSRTRALLPEIVPGRPRLVSRGVGKMPDGLFLYQHCLVRPGPLPGTLARHNILNLILKQTQ